MHARKAPPGCFGEEKLIRARQIVLTVLALLVVHPTFASRELTDELGRHVVVPDHPHRIICLAPSVSETVFALGSADAVVGVSDYTEFSPEARTKPSVGDLINPSKEKILDLRPDLVLATKEINRRETVDELSEAGVPVFVVNPQGLQGILSSIRSVGNALNRLARADALVQRLDERRKKVETRVQGLSRRPTVFVVIWYEPVVTAGSKAFITEVISAAGGDSVTADIPQAWPQISLEEVIRRSPQYILLTTGSHRGITIEELRARGGWNQLEAIRKNQILTLDDRLLHSSPVVFDALEELAKKLHPEVFRSAEDQHECNNHASGCDRKEEKGTDYREYGKWERQNDGRSGACASRLWLRNEGAHAAVFQREMEIRRIAKRPETRIP